MYEQRVRRASGMRIIALLLAVILFIPLTPGMSVSAAAADTTIPESAFTIVDNVITAVDKTNYNNAQYTRLVIPSGVTEIEMNVFANMSSIVELVIPNSVTKIGDRSFMLCTGLESVTIPGSVTSVGGAAFYGCSKLKSVTLLASANSTMQISDAAFESCGTSISETDVNVYAAHSALFVGNCFTKTTGKTIKIHANAGSSAGLYTKEGGTAEGTTKEGFQFEQLAGNSEAAYSYEVIPATAEGAEDNVRITGYYSDAQQAAIPAAVGGLPVTVVGGTAFTEEVKDRGDANKVTSVDVGKDVTTIEEGAFSGIKDGTTKAEVNVDKENEHLSDWVLNNQNDYNVGELPDKLQKITVSAEPEDAVKAADTPEGADAAETDGVLHTSVGKDYVPYVFVASTDGKSVTTNIQTVPKLRTDGYPAYIFTNWKLLADTSDTTGKDISNIYINDVKLPETVLTIPPVEYTNVRLIAHYEKVPDAEDSLVRKFDSSNNQHYICAYNGVVSNGAITSDLVIENTYDGHQVTQIGYTEEYNGVAYTGVVFKDRGLKTVRFGSGVNNVLPQAFDEAFGLKKIEVDSRHDKDVSGLTAGQYFSRSISGKEDTGVLFKKTNEGVELVAYPLGLTNDYYEIPEDVTGIGERAFAGCTNIKSVKLNANLETIGKEAFMGCENLTSVTWGKNEKTIGSNAFSGTGLTLVELPESVASIGDGAFANCTKLKEITISNSTAGFGTEVFAGSGTDASVTLPITLFGYEGSTTKDYVTNKAASENLQFKAIGAAGSYNVVIDQGSDSRDWLWVSVDGNSHDSVLTAAAGTYVTVGVRKLGEEITNGARLLNEIKITSAAATDGDGVPFPIVKPVKLMIIENQKAGLTINDITCRFKMPEAHVTISIAGDTGWETEDYSPLPGEINAEPAPLT